MTTITGSSIQIFRLLSLQKQLKLEKLGLKSSGGAIRPRIAKEFGLGPRAPYEAYHDAIRDRINDLQADADEGATA